MSRSPDAANSMTVAFYWTRNLTGIAGFEIKVAQICPECDVTEHRLGVYFSRVLKYEDYIKALKSHFYSCTMYRIDVEYCHTQVIN